MWHVASKMESLLDRSDTEDLKRQQQFCEKQKSSRLFSSKGLSRTEFKSDSETVSDSTNTRRMSTDLTSMFLNRVDDMASMNIPMSVIKLPTKSISNSRFVSKLKSSRLSSVTPLQRLSDNLTGASVTSQSTARSNRKMNSSVHQAILLENSFHFLWHDFRAAHSKFQFFYDGKIGCLYLSHFGHSVFKFRRWVPTSRLRFSCSRIIPPSRVQTASV